ncbi:tyrosine-type recombinase/integrase [Paraburkholderia unamae]|uniref:Site-specific recombinase XerD n=1 Tax=Paraburkholderia unamae TaxID=219649 RepID=A0ABX5K8R9_9BURK|nr:site-specific integrase [Paraburkholderia unamae]PVX61210.1 site-specific recombinase XerD [Paraburkholderia unamae]
MPRLYHALDDLQLRRWLAAKEPISRADGDGLTFTLSEFGTASWILRYSRGARRREVTLGNYPDMGLAEARKRARALRVQIDDGEDPAASKKVEKARVRKAMSVDQLCDDLIAKRFPDLSKNSVELYGALIDGVIRPKLGSLDVEQVTPADIVYLIEHCGRPWSVCDVLMIVLRNLFGHAVSRRQINFNPAVGIKLKSVLGNAPPRRKRIMLSEMELQTLLVDIDGLLGRTNGLMFRILLATCVRSIELITAEKELIDLERGSWRIRTESTKTRQEFLVPLAPSVVEWFHELIALSGDSKWLCPARQRRSKNGHVSRVVLQGAIRSAFKNKGLEIRKFTPHDTRSTAKGHLRNMGFSREISEIALNHKIPGIEGVYDVREEIPERRAAMEAWAQFILECSGGKSPDQGNSTNVVQFRPRRAA